MTSPSQREWEDLFNQVPGSFSALLQAIFLDMDAEERPRREKVGRVVTPRARTMGEVQDVLWPKFSQQPFAEAIQPLLRPSLRGFAARAGFTLSSLHRMIKGTEPLTTGKLEHIAAAAKVSPAYFREYRQMKICEEVQKVLDERPSASVMAYKVIANPRKS